jgi:hypothetical protein
MPLMLALKHVVSMMRDVIAHSQPELRGTVAAHVKWHDDRSTYTGVHAKVRAPPL